MLLLRAEKGVIEVGRSGRPHATWMTGIGFVVMAMLPFTGAGGMTAARWGATVSLLLVAAALFAFARRKPIAISLRVDGNELRIGQRAIPVADCELVLDTGPLTAGTPRSRYRVCLRSPNAPPLILLEGRAPDRVMTDLRSVVGELGLNVRTGWGLPSSARPWARSEPTVALPKQVFSLQPYQRQQRVALTVGGGSIGIGIAMSLMASARLDKGKTIDWGSYTLGGMTVGITLLVAILVGTDRRIARLRPTGIDLERHLMGLRVSQKHLAIQNWVGAYHVQTSEGELAHLLVDLGDSLLAVPCAGQTPEEVERLISGVATSDA